MGDASVCTHELSHRLCPRTHCTPTASDQYFVTHRLCDTTPTCTRADAHCSRAHITVHSSYSTALFQCGHTALAQGKRNLCCAFLCLHFHLVCHVLIERSFCPFPSSHVLTYMLCVKTLSVLDLVWWKLTKPLCCLHSLEWNVWLLGQSDPKHRL